jgi:hypothetical protein
LREFMDGRAWTRAEGAYALFIQAAWLRRAEHVAATDPNARKNRR